MCGFLVLEHMVGFEGKYVVKEILIYGAGGAGRELAFALSLGDDSEYPWKVAGFIDDTEHLCGMIINDLPVLGGSKALQNYSGNIALTIASDPALRRNIYLRIKKNSNLKFPIIICPKAIVSPYGEIGEGSIILPLNYIQPNVKIGNFVWINGGNRIGHDVTIGDFVTIYSAVLFGGGVSIGSSCVIGSGAVILPGITIGNGAVIGAGSVVCKDVPENAKVTGVPAKPLK
jgi:sugar O-acyltransferase (sialic acid O-acetyltransferase NeuD family)